MTKPKSVDFRQPPVLRHLKRLTTPTGVIQHADLEVPDPAHGYSIDDNARALIVCLWHYQIFNDPSVLRLADIYLSYIERVEKTSGDFHNFLSFSENTLDAVGSEDSNGRAIWALGETIACQPSPELVERAEKILNRVTIDRHLAHEHSRTKAYILLGLLGAGRLEEAGKWADRLVAMFEKNNQSNWRWFEDGLYYANGIIPYALAKAARVLNNDQAKEIAIASFIWLDQVSRDKKVPSPIGQAGWYKRGSTKAKYDQQPLEAADMVLAATELFELTGKKSYQTTALDWYGWYDGANCDGRPMINHATGGIFDGLTPKGVNGNQGAESIVTYLVAYLSLSALA